MLHQRERGHLNVNYILNRLQGTQSFITKLSYLLAQKLWVPELIFDSFDPNQYTKGLYSNIIGYIHYTVGYICWKEF